MGMIQLPNKAINFFKQNLDEIFETGALAEGKWNNMVSEHVCKLTTAKYATVTCSNGAGLVALMQIYNRYFGKKRVLLQSNTMYGVKTMVKSGNCELLDYIDCSNETLMPTLEHVKAKIETYDTTDDLIFLVTHIGGLINPEIEGIAEYCKSKNVILLEDCAHSYAATYNGKHSGTFGDAGVYSFYSTKAIFTGEGGVVVTNNVKVGNYLQKYIIYDRFDQEMDIGVNVRQSEMQALLLYSVLQEVDEIIANKKAIADHYAKVCQEKGIKFLDQDAGKSIGNHYKFILLDEKCDVENTFASIQTKTSPVYDYALGESIRTAHSHICLPIWYNQDHEITLKAISELQELKL